MRPPPPPPRRPRRPQERSWGALGNTWRYAHPDETCSVSRCDAAAVVRVTFDQTGGSYLYCRFHARPHIPREDFQ